MNLNVNSQVLAAELRLLNKIAPSKPAIAILSYIRFEAADNRISFYATDLEIGMVSVCAADVREPGTVAIPAAKLLALVEQFPDDDVQIVRDKTQVVVRCGKFTSRLQILPTTDFPKPPEEIGQAITLSGPSLAQSITKTRYAVSTGGPSYAIQGVLLTLVGEVAAMVATDGKRLAVSTMKQENATSELRMVIPTKTLDILAAQISSGIVTMTMGERNSFFRIDDRLLISRMIDGKFPKYESIIPRDNDKKIVINRFELGAALRRVNLVSGENRAVIFDIAPGELKLLSSNADVGSADEVLDVDYTGLPLKISINGDFVLDFANVSVTPTITLALKDAERQMLLLDGDNHLGVIMLMRT